MDIPKNEKEIKNYKFKISDKVKEIYFILLKKVSTKLFYIDISINEILLSNNIQKNICNFGFGENTFLFALEENNEIYIVKEENLNEQINKYRKENKNENINFIEQNSNPVSFYLNDKNELIYIGQNKSNSDYAWLKNLINNNEKDFPIKIPIEIPNILKVKYISVSSKNCFLIDNNGKLYGIGDNEYNQVIEDNIPEINKWTNIPLPENNKRFLKCANGEDYLLCIIEDNKGKTTIYAKGNNNKNQCGIRESKIKNFTKCYFDEELTFKIICANQFFSSAITDFGHLYIWGSINLNTLGYFDSNENINIKNPTLVNKEKNFFIEKISVNSKNIEYPVLVIGRKLENEIYSKKLLYLVKSRNIFDKEYSLILNEIKYKDSSLSPIKICIGDSRAYFLEYDENEIIKQINKSREEINISKEEIKIKELKNFYNSNKLKTYIDFFQITFPKYLNENNISNFINIFHNIKTDDKNLVDFIFYNELTKKKREEKEINNLFNYLLENNIDNEILFKYLKIKAKLNDDNYMNYFYVYILSIYKTFLNILLSNNSIYLSREDRLKIFNSGLNLKRNDGNIYMKIDRFLAKNLIDQYSKNHEILDFEFKQTYFGQVFQSLKNINGKQFFLNKNKRLFKCFFKNETVIDEGGPYHEILSLLCKDLQSDYIKLFIKTENGTYIPNPDNHKDIHKKAYVFIGKLMITMISSDSTLNLNLHPIVWKSILENEIPLSEFKSIHSNNFNIINSIEEELKNKNKKYFDDNKDILYFTISNSNSTIVELIPNGNNISINLDNAKEYIDKAKNYIMNEFQSQIKYIKDGLFSVIPIDFAKILHWKLLEEMVCGRPNIDINEFKKFSIYKEEKEIKWFWKWFENIKEEDRIKYLQFASGRTRLPLDLSEIEREKRHKIDVDRHKTDKIPTSSTCFFQLHLVNYTSYEKFVEMMEKAINESEGIEDVQI